MYEVRDGERVKLNSFWTIPTGTLSSCDVTFVNQTDQANCGCLVCQPPFVSSLLSFPYRFKVPSFSLPLSLSLSPHCWKFHRRRTNSCLSSLPRRRLSTPSNLFRHGVPLRSIVRTLDWYYVRPSCTKVKRPPPEGKGRRFTFFPSFFSFSFPFPFLVQEFDLVWRSVRSSLGSTRIDFIVFSPRKKSVLVNHVCSLFWKGKNVYSPPLSFAVHQLSNRIWERERKGR